MDDKLSALWFTSGHVSSRGINILDGLPTKTPEIFDACAEPRAFALFRKTGQWPDGTQIVKKLSAVRIGPGCDPATLICRSPIGAGIFESDFAGLGMMVKDDKRFSDAPGHWGCFSFGQRPPRTLTLHCDRKTPAKPVTSLSHPGQTM